MAFPGFIFVVAILCGLAPVVICYLIWRRHKKALDRETLPMTVNPPRPSTTSPVRIIMAPGATGWLSGFGSSTDEEAGLKAVDETDIDQLELAETDTDDMFLTAPPPEPPPETPPPLISTSLPVYRHAPNFEMDGASEDDMDEANQSVPLPGLVSLPHYDFPPGGEDDDDDDDDLAGVPVPPELIPLPKYLSAPVDMDYDDDDDDDELVDDEEDDPWLLPGVPLPAELPPLPAYAAAPLDLEDENPDDDKEDPGEEELPKEYAHPPWFQTEPDDYTRRASRLSMVPASAAASAPVSPAPQNGASPAPTKSLPSTNPFFDFVT